MARQSLEERISLIKSAFEQGHDTIPEIVEAVKINYSAVNIIVKKEGIKVKGAKEKTLERLKKAIEEGYTSIREIADKIDRGPSYVSFLIKENKITLIKYRTKMKEEIREKLISYPEKTYKQIAKEFSYSPNTIGNYARFMNLGRKPGIPKGTLKLSLEEREKRKKIIKEGLTLEKMGSLLGIGREAVRNYMTRTGQYDTWLDAKRYRSRQHKKEEFTKLATVVAQVRDKKLEEIKEKDKPLYYTLKYMEGKAKTIEMEKIQTLFSRYFNARESGQIISLDKLGEGLNMFPSYISRILKSAGFEPMYGTRKRGSPVSGEQKELIKRTGSLKIPYADIAYFTGMNWWNITQNLPNHREDKNFSRIQYGKSKRKIPYRIASQIYEAQDLGFLTGDIAELVDDEREMVNYVIDNRSSIEKTIIDSLRVLFPDRSIEKPYLSKL